jgi:hypothetical protein
MSLSKSTPILLSHSLLCRSASRLCSYSVLPDGIISFHSPSLLLQFKINVHASKIELISLQRQFSTFVTRIHCRGPRLVGPKPNFQCLDPHSRLKLQLTPLVIQKYHLELLADLLFLNCQALCYLSGPKRQPCR